MNIENDPSMNSVDASRQPELPAEPSPVASPAAASPKAWLLFGVAAVAAGALLVAVERQPHIYYVLMQCTVSPAAAYLAVECFARRRMPGLGIVFAAMSALFNPIVPMQISRPEWQIVDAMGAVIFVGASIAAGWADVSSKVLKRLLLVVLAMVIAYVVLRLGVIGVDQPIPGPAPIASPAPHYRGPPRPPSRRY